VIIIDVLGTPAPKGSSRAFVNRKTGGAIMAPGGSKVNQQKIKGWSAAVREAAAEAIGERVEPVFVTAASWWSSSSSSRVRAGTGTRPRAA
jgi:hypothetical protein